jgi:hypothetical protein
MFNVTYLNLLDLCGKGNIVASYIHGFMLCEGILVNKDINEGVKEFKKCAAWNDIESILMLMNYYKDDREYEISRLYTLTDKTPFYELYEKASLAYAVC